MAAAGGRPTWLKSNATVEQLMLLAMAFKLCPKPTPEQARAIGGRTGLSPKELQRWFENRQALQGWIQTQPHVTEVELRRNLQAQASA